MATDVLELAASLPSAVCGISGQSIRSVCGQSARVVSLNLHHYSVDTASQCVSYFCIITTGLLTDLLRAVAVM